MIYQKRVEQGSMVVEKNTFVRTKNELSICHIQQIAYKEADRLGKVVKDYGVSDDHTMAFIYFVDGTTVHYNQLEVVYENCKYTSK